MALIAIKVGGYNLSCNTIYILLVFRTSNPFKEKPSDYFRNPILLQIAY